MKKIQILNWCTSSMIYEFDLDDIYNISESARLPDTHLTRLSGDVFPAREDRMFECGVVVIWKGPSNTPSSVLAKEVLRSEEEGLDEYFVNTNHRRSP